MVSHKYKCIFIHLPKTGGESIFSLFDDSDSEIPKHANARQIRAYLGEKLWNEYYKFAFVRNPWDQAVSMYFHLRKPLYQKKRILEKYGSAVLNPINACHVACEKSFTGYCEEIFKNHQIQQEASQANWPVSHYAPFHDWISDEEGNILVDYVGRFEEISENMKEVLSVLGKGGELMVNKNKSRHRHYSYYYNQETIELIRSHYVKDINSFGYSFDRETSEGRGFFKRIRSLLHRS